VKLSERQARTLKLASGMMMLALGAALLVNPSLLHRIAYAILIVAGSAAVAVTISRVGGTLHEAARRQQAQYVPVLSGALPYCLPGFRWRKKEAKYYTLDGGGAAWREPGYTIETGSFCCGSQPVSASYSPAPLLFDLVLEKQYSSPRRVYHGEDR
jgi:hypothetical protein